VAANIELQLLWKIIETQDLHTIDKLKITEEFFLEPQHKAVFTYLNKHFHNSHTYGSVPSPDLVRGYFPNLPYTPSSDTLPTLAEEIRKSYVRVQVLNVIENVKYQVDSDPWLAVNTLREAVSGISSKHELSEDLTLSNAYELLLQEYHLVAGGLGITGIPWPWEILNEDTQGIHNGDFIVIYGRPKSMKTFVGLSIGVHAYNSGKRVLVYSMEMKPAKVLKRVAAILAKVDYQKLQSAKLNEVDYYRFFSILRQLQTDELAVPITNGHVPAFLISGRGKGDKSAGGVSSLQAKIKEFQPDLVIVDGMYLMRDDRGNVRTIDWKSIAHISQDLKITADTFSVPIIGITQANRGAQKDAKDADLQELAYADAIGQDCDMAIRVQKREDPHTKENELVLGFPGTREGKLEAFVIHGIPATNFDFKTAIVSKEEKQQETSKTATTSNRGMPQLPNYKKGN